MTIRIQRNAFDAGAELNAFSRGRKDAGAIVSFTGLVRDLATGDLDRMVIEHYPGMTEKALAEFAQKATARWALRDCLILHRFGDLKPGEQIMMVATAASHRHEAFAAAEFLMDYLKSRAPFWKKEFTRDGAEWVESKLTDESALDRWS